ncbi:DUF6000 family protein [Streptomyces coeruleofuscus]|uniref:DUF6000 family protein n=1 Tax=Streptomyces coeruleofuscus TaxID=66879 RepID=UPI003D15B446
MGPPVSQTRRRPSLYEWPRTLIAVAGRIEFRERLGEPLLASNWPYAGQAYCVAWPPSAPLPTPTPAGSSTTLCRGRAVRVLYRDGPCGVIWSPSDCSPRGSCSRKECDGCTADPGGRGDGVGVPRADGLRSRDRCP